MYITNVINNAQPRDMYPMLAVFRLGYKCNTV